MFAVYLRSNRLTGLLMLPLLYIVNIRHVDSVPDRGAGVRYNSLF